VIAGYRSGRSLTKQTGEQTWKCEMTGHEVSASMNGKIYA